VSGKISSEKLHLQGFFGLRSNIKANTSFESRSLLPRRSRNSMAARAAISTGSESTLTKTVDFKKLQNGSDIRGVAVEGVEGEPVNLTEAVAEAIGAAFAAWLLDRKESDFTTKLRISLGHDSRISAKFMQDAVARGIAGAGLEVVEYGLASTPAMFNSTLTSRKEIFCPVDGAIMITASHLPYNRNGLKFFTSDGGLGKKDITDILERADKIYHVMSNESTQSAAAVANKVAHSVDYMEQYTADLVAAVRKGAGGVERPLEGFHIVVDAGNGAGGFFAGRVLEPLGAVTTGSQFLEPDGMFPNHIPNPEDKKAMEAITKAVLDQKADLGIIFDTDVDRAAAVDSSGRELNRNRLIALLSAIVLEQHPGTTIVTDSVTSDGLTTFIEQKLGGKHHRFKRGYKNVIDEGIRLNSVGEETHLAIETSGHGALKENHWLDDGAYLMVKLLIKLAAAKVAGETSGSQVLSDLIADLEDPAISSEIRFKINQSHADVGSEGFKAYGQQVLDKLDQVVASDPSLKKAAVNHEGIRVSGYGGWFLLRLSLHDPVLPLNIEGPSMEATKKLGEFVLAAVQEFKALDTSALQKYVA
jgi:phosphomannomutase